jgi:hypothetical protein
MRLNSAKKAISLSSHEVKQLAAARVLQNKPTLEIGTFSPHLPLIAKQAARNHAGAEEIDE